MSDIKCNKDLVIKFENDAAATAFAVWLCEQGEQYYWEWMERSEEDDSCPNLTALSFNYHDADGNISTKCGRLDTRD